MNHLDRIGPYLFAAFVLGIPLRLLYNACEYLIQVWLTLQPIAR